jgi:glycosyltransferase involved in cell wall biosynthesis
VANELPVLREVAGAGGESAAQFVPADPAAVGAAVDRLQQDAGERQRLSLAAWRRAHQTFSPVRIVQGYLAVMAMGL